MGVFHFIRSSPTMLLFIFFILAILVGVKWDFVVFICIFLMTNRLTIFSSVLFGHLCIFFGEVSIRILCPFLFYFIIFLNDCFYLFTYLFIYLFTYLFIYLFMAVLGLRCCTRAFSSCSEWGLLFVAVHELLIVVASLVAKHGL